MRVKFTLIPNNSNKALQVNYNYFLTSLIYNIIEHSSKDYSHFLHDTGYRLGGSKNGFKLFTYSMLQGADARVKGDIITFGKGQVSWYLSSPINDFLQHLITGAFAQGQEIEIGPKLNTLDKSIGSNRFLIERVETLNTPVFNKSMHFTCLSPITVSTVLKDLNCHYLRPWEEGFADAIKNNLIKKYKLVYGKDIADADFKVTIDTAYMNKKSGKITKNINFKGTNIIGFMAPIEVAGNPELIEIGYEAGFGEKGSMGFGMVKRTV
ncbi:MAG: CRISPR-associated endoribonuclease Cas6 [Deltaproteobacteria bacterium]|nr:CRISPR-associated endoribonuclease Cas6 [Deltaproteobacteria bacterium]